MDALVLARVQFAANITFHILFPSISIALGWVLTVWQAASPESLKVIVIGVCVTVPVIVAYTGFSYRVFRGKTIELHYA